MKRMLTSMPMYDKKLGAAIYPWVDKLHTIVGLVYVFTDKEKESFLVYMYPQEGEMVALVHVTSVTVTERGRGQGGIRLASLPDPETDKEMAAVSL